MIVTDAERYHQVITWTLEERDRQALENANEALRKAMEDQHESEPR